MTAVHSAAARRRSASGSWPPRQDRSPGRGCRGPATSAGRRPGWPSQLTPARLVRRRDPADRASRVSRGPVGPPGGARPGPLPRRRHDVTSRTPQHVVSMGDDPPTVERNRHEPASPLDPPRTPPLPARRVVLPPHLRRRRRPAAGDGPQPARADDRPALREVGRQVEDARPDAEGARRDGGRGADRLLLVHRLRLLDQRRGGRRPGQAARRPDAGATVGRLHRPRARRSSPTRRR